MKKLNFIINVLLLAAIAMFFINCAEDVTPSLFESDYVSGPAPVVSGIIPADSAYSVITNLVINGQNFSATIEKNAVFFNGTKAELLTATTGQLVVKTPYMIGDSIKIRIAVHGADKFNENQILYKLKDPAPELFRFPVGDVPWYITADSEGNVYTSLVSSGVGQGVIKITPGGVQSSYAPRQAELYWASLTVGPGGTLICARGIRALFQVPAGGGVRPGTWAVNSNRSVKITATDFDAELNCWAVGDNEEIYRIKPDKSILGFPFVGNVYSVRVFADFVYLAAQKDSLNKIFRFPIVSTDELGAEEEYFDFSAAFSGFKPYSITFAADGDMYIGTDAPESIVVVHSDGSYEPLYPGLFEPVPSMSLAWSNGNDLYVTRMADGEVSQTILKVGMSKPGAPYYGRDN